MTWYDIDDPETRAYISRIAVSRTIRPAVEILYPEDWQLVFKNKSRISREELDEYIDEMHKTAVSMIIAANAIR